MAHTLGMSIQQHQQKSLLKFYVLPRAKKEPLSRKILGKAVQNAVGKGTGPSNLPDTAVGIFLSRLKKWAQKSPEAVLFPLTGTQTVTSCEGAELAAPSFFLLSYAGN